MLALSRKRWLGQAWLIAWTHSFPRKLITECLVTKNANGMGGAGLWWFCGHVPSDLFMEILDPLNFVSVARLGLVSNLVYNMHSPPTACCAFREPQNAFPQVLHMTQWFWLNVFPPVKWFLTITNSGLEGKAWRRSKASSMQSWRLGVWHQHSLLQLKLKCWNYFRYSCWSFFPNVNLHIDLI